jgi:hypothetical protein
MKISDLTLVKFQARWIRGGLMILVVGLCGPGAALSATAAQSIARDWNEQILSAIRLDTPHPPAHARNLFSLSVCMYDAWAAYDDVAVGYVYRDKHIAGDSAAARREAISFAAWRILKERFAYSRSAATTLATLDAHLVALTYSPGNASRDTSTPAGVGNSVYDAVSAWFINDGSRQTNGTPYPLVNPPIAYPDYPVGEGGYVYVNPPLPAAQPGVFLFDVNRWQRLQIVNAVDQNGFPQGPLQTYLGAQWLGVRPFALTREDPNGLWIDPGPPPMLGTSSDLEFRSNVVAVIRASSELTPDDGVTINISPGSFGNNPLGSNDGHGHSLNPFTGEPYSENLVKRGDFTRVLAEFWADGPSSETPPGHWNTIANAVSDHPSLTRQIGGTGPVVEDLEWDVKLYFCMNAAVHDAACAAWGTKRYYDAWRPISAVRYMGQLGQSTDVGGPFYHPNGLPLIPNLIELVTSSSVASGRHAGLVAGKIAILAWPGQPANPTTTYQGVKWLHADTWVPYQRTNFVTPAFPGYISGHSTFSRAAAEVLAGFTGSPFFPGGMGTYSVPANTGLGFERGPSEPTQLQWGTYFDASDQAGLSRIWGGIHPPADDIGGRISGSHCGQRAWALAQKYFDGSIVNTPVFVAMRRLSADQCELRYNTPRGLFHKLQSAVSLDQPFEDDGGGFVQALDTAVVRTNAFTGQRRFFRVVTTLSP